MRRSLRVGLLAVALAVAASAVRAGPALTLEAADPAKMEPVFLWTRDRCAEDDIPDAPLRAVRLDSRHVLAFATHEQNRRFVGAELGALRRDCRIVFSGQRSDKPEDYSDRVWISALWSEDGRTIFALGHDEYQAHRHPNRCRFSTYLECWYNAIVPLRSDDGGETFSRVGERPVATLPIRQDVDQGHPRGFFEPTNIIKRGDAFFTLIRAGAESPQKAGTCLFRADDLARPESWRFFDGEGFSENVDPYRDDVSEFEAVRALERPERERRVGRLRSRARALCRRQRLRFKDFKRRRLLLFCFDRPYPLERGAPVPRPPDALVRGVRSGPLCLSVARRPPFAVEEL